VGHGIETFGFSSKRSSSSSLDDMSSWRLETDQITFGGSLRRERAKREKILGSASRPASRVPRQAQLDAASGVEIDDDDDDKEHSTRSMSSYKAGPVVRARRAVKGAVF